MIRPILLCGHRDTVFATGEVEKRPFTMHDGKAFGPGVADMKPGLVINAFILAAFHKFGGHPNPLIGLFTGDEEIGSPSSKNIIIAEAEKARLAFNSEPSRPNGNIVTKRKGGIFCHCAIKGVAAHSGGFFTDGRQRDRRAGPQDSSSTRADGPRKGHNNQCWTGARWAISEHSRC